MPCVPRAGELYDVCRICFLYVFWWQPMTELGTANVCTFSLVPLFSHSSTPNYNHIPIFYIYVKKTPTSIRIAVSCI